MSKLSSLKAMLAVAVLSLGMTSVAVADHGNDNNNDNNKVGAVTRHRATLTGAAI